MFSPIRSTHASFLSPSICAIATPLTCIASISKPGAITLEATNPGDVLTWTTDNNFVIRGATAFDGKTGASIMRVRDAADKPWRDLVVMPFERALFGGEVFVGSLIAGFDPDGKSLVIHSAVHSDKGRLVRVDLRSGQELGVVAQDPQSDVADQGELVAPEILTNPATNAIEAVLFDYTTPHWVFLDPKMERDFAGIERDVSGLKARPRSQRQGWIMDRPDQSRSGRWKMDHRRAPERLAGSLLRLRSRRRKN